MPSAATTTITTTTIASNNNSKEKRASVSSIGGGTGNGGGSVGGFTVGAGGAGSGSVATTNGQHTSSGGGNPASAVLGQPADSDLANNNASNGNTSKALKTGASAALVVSEPYNPLKQILVIIEHKIRNLEKRKVGLDIPCKKEPKTKDSGAAWPTIFIFIFSSCCFVSFCAHTPLIPSP